LLSGRPEDPVIVVNVKDGATIGEREAAVVQRRGLAINAQRRILGAVEADTSGSDTHGDSIIAGDLKAGHGSLTSLDFKGGSAGFGQDEFPDALEVVGEVVEGDEVRFAKVDVVLAVFAGGWSRRRRGIRGWG
jgi:hypothetical protein